MTTQAIRYPTLASELWQGEGWLRAAVLALAGSLLLTVSAKVQIPFYPVPLTMQTFVVLAIGVAFGWKLENRFFFQLHLEQVCY